MPALNEHLTLVRKIGNFLSNILLGETKELIIRTDERVQHLLKASDEVKKSIDDFRVSITVHGSDIKALQIHTRYGVNNSPTVPNEEGKKLLQDSGFEVQYPKFKDNLFALMDIMNLRTLYDYEVGAIDALKQFQNNPLMDPVKDYVVSHPEEPLDLIFKIASWIIRDDYHAVKSKTS